MTQTQAQTATLYERLGGAAGMAAIAKDVVAAHLENPVIAPRFRQLTAEQLELTTRRAYEFFASGSGGPETYTGRPLPEAHAGMNVSDQEFVATCDDVLAVLRAHGIGEREQGEILGIFFALKDQVLRL